MQAGTNKPDAYVVPDGTSFKVVPPVALPAAAWQFTIKNLTKHEVTVDLSPGGLDGTQNVTTLDQATFNLDQKTPPGVYPYKVWVHDSRKYPSAASGGSDPKIIVDA